MPTDDTGLTPETVLSSTLGTDLPADTSGKTPDKVDAPDVGAQLESERKERQKIEMERNHLRKKIEDSEANSLREKEDYKTLADSLQAKLDALEAEEAEKSAEKEATDFRNEFIAKQPDKLAKVLRNLIAANPTNFLWSNAKDWDDARSQLETQATLIAEAVGIDTDADIETKNPKINANNPAVKLGGLDPEDMSLADLRKLLPKAPSR